MSKLPTVFLSYAWANKAEADEIDKHFESIGLQFRRDVRDLEYKSSIKEFMQQVGKTDFAVMLISDEFLNSSNCMYEVLELMRNREFEEKLLQVILPSARIFNAKYRIKVIKAWNAKREEIEAEIKTLPSESMGSMTEELKHLREICNSIEPFMKTLVDQNSISYDILKANNHEQLVQFMGMGEDDLLKEVIRIQDHLDKKEARRMIDRFTRENPKYPRGFFVLAFLQDEPKDSIYYYDQAIELDPNDARAYYNRGNSKSELGDYKDAIADYDQAIELDPNNAMAYNNRGNSKSDLGDEEGAIADYDQAIVFDPNFAEPYNNRGYSKTKLGDYKDAIPDFDQAIVLDPNFEHAYQNRGASKYKLGDYKDAIPDFDQAIELDPNNAMAYNNRGTSKSILGDKEGAIADYDQAIALDPDYAAAYYNRGNSKFKLGDYKDAIADFDQVIVLDPNNAMAYNNRGNSKSKLGDEEGAKKDWDKAIELDPSLKEELGE